MKEGHWCWGPGGGLSEAGEWPSLRPEGMRWWAWSLFIPMLAQCSDLRGSGKPRGTGETEKSCFPAPPVASSSLQTHPVQLFH